MSEVMSVVVGVGRGEYDEAGAVVEIRVPGDWSCVDDGTGIVVKDGFVVGETVATVVGVGSTAVGVGLTGSTESLSPVPWLTAYAMPRTASSRAATATAARTGVSCGIDVLRVGLPVPGSLDLAAAAPVCWAAAPDP